MTSQPALFHRDLSWLQFNERVLEEAKDETHPTMERIKFLAISQSNLDEFFTIRFASLVREETRLVRQNAPAAKVHAIRLLRDQILSAVRRSISASDQLFTELLQNLSSQFKELNRLPQDHPQLVEWYQTQVAPFLEKSKTFRPKDLTQLGNLQMGFLWRHSSTPPAAPQWLPIPKNVPRVFFGPEGFCFLEDLLMSNTRAQGAQASAFVRLSRDGDYTFDIEEEDTESIPDIVRTSLKKRDKGRAVRLQTQGLKELLSPTVFDAALQALQIAQEQTFVVPNGEPLAMHSLLSLYSLVKSDGFKSLYFPPAKHSIPKLLTQKSTMFDRIKAADVLLHHPYDSFDAFVQWIELASQDPSVNSISLTLYRTDPGSELVRVLKKAAQTKTVRVMIELRARFDELNNLKIGEELKTAGAKVFFGTLKLKIHAKIALITRMENQKEVHYTHLSTGNYHPITARQYTDLAILTAHPEIGIDAKYFFDSLAEERVPKAFKRLLSAPTRLHRKMLSLIDAEIEAARAGKEASITAKVNALVDEGIIGKLYAASSAGVKVQLIVRGACSIVPGIQGVSDNITVISIIDRYLEHSRIYYFKHSSQLFLSSADWMPRNFFSRLEIAFPILDAKVKAFITDVLLPTYLNDPCKARVLGADLRWTKRTLSGPSAQAQFALLSEKGYAGTPLMIRRIKTKSPT